MECPYCGVELIYDDEYGTGLPESWSGTAGCGIHYPSTYKKLGDIYKCPNYEGFEDLDEAKVYQEQTEDQKDRILEEICCDSSCCNGFFYTDLSENLYEGYPC